ncbi:MAG: type II toxin-antitoxin system YafQ family toxin [Anaerovoracaceae bacterium]
MKRGYNPELIEEVIDMLANGISLPAKYKDHLLKGEYAGLHECHISSDWLLIYYIDGKELVLYLTRTGTHSDLF